MKNPPLSSKASYIYGPVPSRRLGYSLGVDILPFKTCTLDCIYCQLGPTLKKAKRRKTCFSQEDILKEIKQAIKSGQQIDFITFSGSGEPTLNTAVGNLIREIKKITEIPVAVLTNSTLLSLKSVRDALKAADVVVPSLDAASQDILEKVNRPHPSLRLDKIINGLKLFRKEFKGQIWLEIMLVKSMNDSAHHIAQLKKAVSEINPEKLQLNTVVRPPAETYAQPLTQKELETIKKAIGHRAEIIAEFGQKPQIPSRQDLKKKIMEMAKRRPVTAGDMTPSLGCSKKDTLTYVNELVSQGKLKRIMHRGKAYYEPVGFEE